MERIQTNNKFNMIKASNKSRTAALLFALFLGSAGAHRFYVGKIGTGVTQLILTLTLVGAIVSGIWALIDTIMILAGGFKDKDGLTVEKW